MPLQNRTGLSNILKPEQLLQRPVSIKRSNLYFLKKTRSISISNSRSLQRPGLIIESLEYVVDTKMRASDKDLPVKDPAELQYHLVAQAVLDSPNDFTSFQNWRIFCFE